ncbi:Fe(3+)-hydroxamate ABC transporter permease FhuB [Mycobacterium sp. KBS0706]|uniref:Fe(3+)-hydroxamate ABC transporter permease FhuB n=1 Tax=Mycobacterium sp. KBS0706 TaxID=2578109 RepID=UPI00110FA256|nr:Fe(3+)-hydroxamate ABC transporter permease FhuB [Mycobacterium sp. KBS0706]TSD83061.1 Fe(3+)-hydroxamate ABC transporter permease FhuB [Mycobacterium sp. KBS0706]
MADLALPRPAATGRPALLAALLIVAALALFLHHLRALLPVSEWQQALTAPDPADMRQMLAQYSLLPRVAVGLLGGAALGLAGVLFQQALRNPLAEAGTLGVFAGARLALIAASLSAPALLDAGQEAVALLGSAAAMALILLLSWRHKLAPIAVILAGLVVTFYLDAGSKMLVLFNHQALTDLFVSQGGSLNQNSWDVALTLAPRLALAALAGALMLRPLTLLDLDEDGARGLGLSPAAARLAAIAVAVLLSASVAALIGPIGFIGLAGPAIARLAGARRFRDRLAWGPAVSAGLLALTDQLVQFVDAAGSVPTGAVTALLGAPLLLWLLRRLRPAAGEARPDRPAMSADHRRRHPWPWVVGVLLVLGLVVWAALALGRTPEGWRWSLGGEFDLMLPWRMPRVAAALGAGFMLATAGVVLQRLTGNAMASPELLGVSSGAALALILAALIVPGLDRLALTAVAGLGALAALLAVLSLGRRSAFSSEHMLLAGTALTTVAGAFMIALLFSGDPRTALLLGWLSGSTYGVSARDAAITCGLALAAALILPLAGRWLTILPLGAATARALGVSLSRSRVALLLLTSALTAGATLTVGPLSFVGLMAPHMVRMLGLRRPTPQILAAGLLGAGLMVLADWLGRTVAFPWQVPAGLVATFVGGTYFIWLMQRRRPA